MVTPDKMIDSDGFRANVGIILSNYEDRVLWARRAGMDAWQFPQGGIRQNETPEIAMFRELHEEIGLAPQHVRIIGYTRKWLRYRLPKHYIRYDKKPVCVGQKQIWFMLRLLGEDSDVRLDLNERPEFDQWQWVNYWHPLQEIVGFKRAVYKKALTELAPLILSANARWRTHKGA